MKEKLYRFTLAFDGQPQDIGILQGLEDTGVDASVSQEFYKRFAALPCPLLETPDDSPVECWFREKGLLKFRDVLNAIIYELSCVNWQVLCQVIEDDIAGALYTDEFQVAYASTYLETDKTKFKEIGSIKETEPYINYLSQEVTLMDDLKDFTQSKADLIETALSEIERAVSQIHFATLDIRSFDYEERRKILYTSNLGKAKMLVNALKEEAQTLEFFIKDKIYEDNKIANGGHGSLSSQIESATNRVVNTKQDTISKSKEPELI